MKQRQLAIGVVAAAVLLVVVACTSVADTGWRGAFEVLKLKVTLLEKLGADAFGIDVERRGQTVVLSGEVGSRATQELADEVMLSVKGVTSVENHVRTKPEQGGAIERAAKDAGREIDDGILETKVKLKLYEELGEHGHGIEVEAVEGVVSLRGPVPDGAREKLAIRSAGSVKGVTKVIDLLEVTD